MRARGFYYRIRQFPRGQYCTKPLHPRAWLLLLQEFGLAAGPPDFRQTHGDVPYPRGEYFLLSEDHACESGTPPGKRLRRFRRGSGESSDGEETGKAEGTKRKLFKQGGPDSTKGDSLVLTLPIGRIEDDSIRELRRPEEELDVLTQGKRISSMVAEHGSSRGTVGEIENVHLSSGSEG